MSLKLELESTQLDSMDPKGVGVIPWENGKTISRRRGNRCWTGKRTNSCYTLHAWRSTCFEGIQDKNLLAFLDTSMTHGVSSTPSQFRHLLDLPFLFLHPEPEEAISEHSKRKHLIEKKFGNMTEK